MFYCTDLKVVLIFSSRHISWNVKNRLEGRGAGQLMSLWEMGAAVHTGNAKFKPLVSVWGVIWVLGGDTVTLNTHRPGMETQLHWHQNNLRAHTAARPLTPLVTCFQTYSQTPLKMKKGDTVNRTLTEKVIILIKMPLFVHALSVQKHNRVLSWCKAFTSTQWGAQLSNTMQHDIRPKRTTAYSFPSYNTERS